MTQKRSNRTQTFAQAFAELQKITEQFERDDFDLDRALEEYERGLRLAKQLKDRLKTLENTVEQMKKKISAEE